MGLGRVSRALDRAEPAIEVAIRLAGWSAIFFVFCIFFFIFREGAPFLFNGLEVESRTDPATDTPQIVFTDLPFEMPEQRLVERLEEGRDNGTFPEVVSAEIRIVSEDDDGMMWHVADARGGSPGGETSGATAGKRPAGPTTVAVVATLEPGADPQKSLDRILEKIPMREGSGHIAEFFTSTVWRPDSVNRPTFGILALLLGSLSVTALAMFLAVPLSLGAAIYISEFCKGKAKESLKVTIEILAAIPSIVWGFIGYMLMNPLLIWLTGRPVGLNMLNGGIILAFMSIPIIVSLAEDALKAVPESYREAAIGLGASRWEVVYKVLLPAAKNGLLAAVLLGFGRSIGETMAVLMVTGHALNVPTSIFDSVRTMTATIAQELGEAVQGGPHYSALFLIGIVLMIIALAINLLADLLVKGVRGKQNG